MVEGTVCQGPRYVWPIESIQSSAAKQQDVTRVDVPKELFLTNTTVHPEVLLLS